MAKRTSWHGEPDDGEGRTKMQVRGREQLEVRLDEPADRTRF
jgi:hypothetical protein